MQVALRSLFFVVTTLVVLLALLLSTGRVLTWQLDDARANSWLNPQGVSVQGISARWRLLNPVIDVRKLRLGDSSLDDVVVELDWLESLLRQALVLRHLSVGEGNLVVAYTPSRSWHLAGMPATEQQRSWFDTVYESDELQYSGLLTFKRDAQQGDIRVAAALVNRGGSHRADVTLRDPGCLDQCQLRLQFDDREALWPLWYRELAASAQTFGRGIAIPSPLLMGTQARLADFRLRWDRTATRLGSGIAADAGIGAGLDFVLQLDEITAPGGLPFSMHLAADGTSIGGVATARVQAGQLALTNLGDETLGPNAQKEAQAARTLELPPMWLQWTPTALRAYVPKLSADAFIQFAADTRLPDDVVGQWLQALGIQGQLSDLRLQRLHEDGLLGYQADFADVSMQGHRGVPLVRNGAGQVTGQLSGLGQSIRFDVASPQMTLGFPDIFLEPWELEDFSGGLTLLRADGVLRLVGRNVQGNFEEYQAPVPNRMLLGFDLHLPPDRAAQILSIGIRLNQASLPKAKTFLPTKLGAGVRQWLMRAPQEGTMADVDFAYIGHLRGDQGPQSRRAAMRARVSDGVVVYHEAWPLVRDIQGDLQLSGQEATMQVVQARTQNLRIGASDIRVSAAARRAVVELEAKFDAADGLDFVRQTPLRNNLSFVRDEWRGAGPVQTRGSLAVPLDQGDLGVTADLNFDLQGVNLTLPELRMPLRNLKGNVDFESPSKVRSNALTGRLYGSAWKTKINTEAGDSQAVVFAVDGEVLPSDVYQLLDLQDPGFAQGASSYQAILRFPTSGQTPSLQLTGDLVGTELTLPGQLAKTANQARGLSMQAQFADTTTELRLSYPGLVGALQIANGGVQRGALQLSELAAVATPIPQFDPTSEQVLLGGTLAELDIGAFGSSDTGLLGQVPFAIDNLNVQQLRLDTSLLGPTQINGSLQGANLAVELSGDGIAGKVQTAQDAPLELRLDHLRLPAEEVDPELPASDPVDPSLIAQLPTLDVVIEDLHLGDEAFGRWQFVSRVNNNNLIFEGLQAQVKGLDIKADTLMWHGDTNQTHFAGALKGTNLAEVLPQFGYEPTLTTSDIDAGAVVSWPGSPIFFDLNRLQGEIFFAADDGRFLDVDTAGGALRIFSLLNFSAIAKRINFDFSDVVGKGVSFDDLGARVQLADGQLTFVEPMEVEGTGSSFLLAGRVNLVSGELDNEMIVTLPVTKGLPWYGAYLAIANPLAGLGVLVGERVLRKPLEQFSSAKYRISGTIDDPQVEFVNVFDRSMNMDLEPPADAQQATDPQADPNPGATEPVANEVETAAAGDAPAVADTPNPN